VVRAGALALALLVGLAAAGCGDDGGDAGGSGTPTIVALGDSIPLNEAATCPGCDGFVDTYAEEVGARVDNLAVHGRRVLGVAEQLESGEAADELRDADLVIVSFGANDYPPYRGTRQPCRIDETPTFEAAVAAVAATTRRCVDRVVRATLRTATVALADVVAQAPDARLVVLAPYDFWRGWPELRVAPEDQVAAAEGTVAYAVRQWRDRLCELVEDLDGTCVDLYTAFNGPDGERPAGDLLSTDHIHPSQAGNDLIRDLLIDADLLG